MSDEYLDRPGSRIAYDVRGAGRVAVAAHGMTSSRAAERAPGAFDWSVVADTARLVRYDARGHGASSGGGEARTYSWEALAEDLLALTREVAPDEPVDAVGASMGVGTILWATLRAPERFRRLVLAIPPTAWETRAAQAASYREGAEFVRRRGLRAYVRAGRLEPQIPIAEQGGWPRSTPDVTEELLPSVLEGAALSDLPPAEDLATLQHPVLLLPWVDDPGHPASTAQVLADTLPKATLEVAHTPDDVAAWGPRAAAFLSERG